MEGRHHTQLSGQQQEAKPDVGVYCSCPTLHRIRRRAVFFLATAAGALVLDGVILCYLSRSCEQLLFEDWCTLAVHVRLYLK